MDIILTGVGGQGSILASKLLAKAFLKKGEKIISSETIGMAQRGGSVTSHLRVGEGNFSPMVNEGSADIIIAFEPSEAVRCLPYLKKGGNVIVANKGISPVTASLLNTSYDANEMITFLEENVKNLIVVNSDKLLNELGSFKVLNTLLLGASLKSDALKISYEELEEVIKENVKKEFIELNLKAVKLGMI